MGLFTLYLTMSQRDQCSFCTNGILFKEVGSCLLDLIPWNSFERIECFMMTQSLYKYCESPFYFQNYFSKISLISAIFTFPFQAKNTLPSIESKLVPLAQRPKKDIQNCSKISIPVHLRVDSGQFPACPVRYF